MENTNNSLSHRQVDVVRKNLLSVFRFAVKALIDKACFCSIDDGCEEFINFCATMEHILQHRLRPSKAWYLGDDRSHFWFYIKAACHRQDLRCCITNIDNIENIKSPVAKGRAFVRCALMEKRLSEYLAEALKQINITRRYYRPGAIMLGEEATELCGILLGLNSIDFGFCVRGENYDTVECPLAINYSPFMKFRQSPESLYSDLEEMRELSCGSSLASEDGQDTPPPDCWPERFNALHKRYMRVLEQKSFLEEVLASQEKALQAAAVAQQEVGRLQRDAAFQKHQYEGVILELQAQVTRMKTINETLQQQLLASRGARFPMVEMDRRGEKGERGGEASRFAAAMGHKLDSDRQSLTSSYDRTSVGGKTTGDTRSLTSAMSEISVDVMGQGQGAAARVGEDSQSMVPLTGSIGDLHLDLEPGTAVSESSNVTNPQQATPVVSISSGVYTSTFAEINGNGDSNVQLRQTSVQVTKPSPAPTTVTAATGEGSESQQAEDTSTTEPEKEAGESTNLEQSSETPLEATSAPSDDPQSQNISDGQSEGSGMSEPEELMPESSSGEEGESVHGEHDSQDPEVLSHMTSSKESAISDRDDSSEPEVLTQEDGGDSSISQSGVQEEAATASSGHCEDAPEPQIIQDEKVGKEPLDKASDVLTQEGFSDVPSSDREEMSDPEILMQEEEEVDKEGTDPQNPEAQSGQGPTPDQDRPKSDAQELQLAESEPAAKGDQSESKEKVINPAEEAEKEGGSDSGSSDENKDTWDMLSDANPDSSS